MTQFGMNMPGGQLQRSATMNVYTGLLFLAVLALIAACVFVALQSRKIAPNGQPFSVQEYDQGTKTYRINLPS